MGLVFRGQLEGRALTVNVADASLTVSIGTGEVVAWDLGGRVYSVWRDGRTRRRGLSGRVLEKWHDAGVKHRRHLMPQEVDDTVSFASAVANRALQAIDRSGATGTRERTLASEALHRAAAFDAGAARADAERFADVYGEVGILPPDQYLSLVLQATEGCAFSTCTFCDLYKQKFRSRSAPEFSDHLRDVREFMGPSLGLRSRSVFLGAGNALLLPTDRLVALLDAIPPGLGAAPPVCGFIDAFTGARKTAAEYRLLREHGLARVYIGMESGHDRLLAFVRKPGGSAEAVGAVGAMKRAGLDVGIMVIVGLGGDGYADGHVSDTVAALNAMPLTPTDFVYFSDLVEAPSGAYAVSAAAAGIRPLSVDERLQQKRAIASALTFPAGRPRFATYDVGEFVY